MPDYILVHDAEIGDQVVRVGLFEKSDHFLSQEVGFWIFALVTSEKLGQGIPAQIVALKDDLRDLFWLCAKDRIDQVFLLWFDQVEGHEIWVTLLSQVFDNFGMSDLQWLHLENSWPLNRCI